MVHLAIEATSSANVCIQPNVRRAIETHVVDHSAAVRDAAVELIGKYMIDSPAFASDYYQKVADRIAVCSCTLLA